MSKAPVEIDRTKVCPLLLRIFWRVNRNNAAMEYKSVSQGVYPQNELQIYTWPDATLREFSDLLKGSVDIAGRKNVSLQFSLVYPDRNGVHLMKPIGKVSPFRKGPDDDIALGSTSFQTGDFIDVGIVSPQNVGRGF